MFCTALCTYSFSISRFPSRNEYQMRWNKIQNPGQGEGLYCHQMGRPLLPSNGKASYCHQMGRPLLPSNGKASTAIKWEGLYCHQMGRPLLPSNGKVSTAIKWEGLLLPSNGKASTAIKWEGLLLPSNGKASAAIKWETGKVLKLLNFSFCVGVRKIKGKLQGAIWVENISSKGNGLRWTP